MAANVTFIGAKETGVEVLTWGDLKLPANKAVLVDPDEAKTAEQRTLYEHLLTKGRNHPHFKIEDVKAKKAKGRDDEDDDEENGNGDYDLSTLPKDWRDLHHKKIIAIAKRLGGEGEALATRDGAIAYVEEQLALGTIVSPEPF